MSRIIIHGHDHAECREEAKTLIDKSDRFIIIAHLEKEQSLSVGMCRPRDMTIPLAEAMANDKLLYLILKSATVLADIMKEVQWTEPFTPPKE